jgi:hypothetical protein
MEQRRREATIYPKRAGALAVLPWERDASAVYRVLAIAGRGIVADSTRICEGEVTLQVETAGRFTARDVSAGLANVACGNLVAIDARTLLNSA